MIDLENYFNTPDYSVYQYEEYFKKACTEGKLNIIKDIYEREIRFPQDIKMRGIAQAILNRKYDVFNYILQNPYQALDIYYNQNEIMHEVCEAGDVQFFKDLIENHRFKFEIDQDKWCGILFTRSHTNIFSYLILEQNYTVPDQTKAFWRNYLNINNSLNSTFEKIEEIILKKELNNKLKQNLHVAKDIKLLNKI